MKELDHAAKNDVVKSNALIEAAYHPGSIYQQRLLLVAATMIKAKEKVDHKEGFRITASGMADLFRITKEANYEGLAKAAKDLMGMRINIKERPNGEAGEVIKSTINVVAKCEYREGEGCIILYFTTWILPYLSDLSSHFTCYNIQFIAPMKCIYSSRLYELCLKAICIMEENEHYPKEVAEEFTINELKRLLGIEGKYKKIKDFKTAVIFKARDEINKFSNIKLRVSQRKAGKVVTHIQFFIKRNEKALTKKQRALKRVSNEPSGMSAKERLRHDITLCNNLENLESKAKADELRKKLKVPITNDQQTDGDEVVDTKTMNLFNSDDSVVVDGEVIGDGTVVDEVKIKKSVTA